MRELFAQYVNAEGMIFKHARGRSVEEGKEFHGYHEIIYFMEGDAEFITEEFHIDLEPEMLLVIPKETYHQVIIRGDRENYLRCIVQFDDTFAQGVFTEKSLGNVVVLPSDREIGSLFEQLIRRAEDENAALLLGAVLVLLLQKISENREIYVSERPRNEVVKQAISYINRNLNRKITVEEISNQCMLSPSALSHIFKREMNIPLHKFIVKKRLIQAYHKISAGELPTVAALECGFNDYSGFYKQYKKMFNAAPSDRSLEFPHS
ncbi:MAG: helix-turn-helix transcriptional regulator [Clostridia bacterium]|nr:helix-turn-helix transcriptional regulator [Clostridia bacterium]